MIGGYHSFGPGGFRDTPLADVLPIDIGPAQRQSFGEPLRKDVHLPGPVRMRPAAPLGRAIQSCKSEVVPIRQPPALPGVEPRRATPHRSGHSCRRSTVRTSSSAAS